MCVTVTTIEFSCFDFVTCTIFCEMKLKVAVDPPPCKCGCPLYNTYVILLSNTFFLYNYEKVFLQNN